MNKNKITALKEKIGGMSKFQRMALCYGAFFIVSGIAMAKIVAVLCGEFSTASYPRALLLSFTSAPGLLLNAVFAAILDTTMILRKCGRMGLLQVHLEARRMAIL